MEGRFVTHSTEETERLAASFARSVRDGDCIALFGGLGAGKTAFVRGLVRGLGIRAEVSSPTFALVHEYRGERVLAHFDMYRITGLEDLETTGFFDYLDGETILAVEWSENIRAALPARRIEVSLVSDGADERTITIRRVPEGGA